MLFLIALSPHSLSVSSNGRTSKACGGLNVRFPEIDERAAWIEVCTDVSRLGGR